MPDNRPTRVWLVRHTQTDWNRDSRYQGHADRPLTRLGERHAALLGARLGTARYGAVFTSDLVRTDRLGQVAAAQRGAQAIADTRWREVDHGEWDGLTAAEVESRFADDARARYRDPWTSRAHKGENGQDVWNRIARAWGELLTNFPGERVLVVTHASPIQMLVCAALGAPPEHHAQVTIGLGRIARLDVHDNMTVVRSVNESWRR